MDWSSIPERQRQGALDCLMGYVTDQRQELFEKVLDQRTRYITLALEDIFQSQNASAVLRTSDCLGVQDVHIIENRNTYQINPDVTIGSSQWLSLSYYQERKQNTARCISHLKEQGYRIIATSPHADAATPQELSLDGKIALLFGTELDGLSPEALGQADEYLRFPMYGFTESYNISVAAALCLSHLMSRLRSSEIDWPLLEEEKQELRFSWCMQTVKRPELILGRHLESQ